MSRILIIEDEIAIADLERDYLELSDFEIIEHCHIAFCKSLISIFQRFNVRPHFVCVIRHIHQRHISLIRRRLSIAPKGLYQTSRKARDRFQIRIS